MYRNITLECFVGEGPFCKRVSRPHPLEQINFEMLNISKFSFSQKMRFAEPLAGLCRLRLATAIVRDKPCRSHAVFKRSFLRHNA